MAYGAIFGVLSLAPEASQRSTRPPKNELDVRHSYGSYGSFDTRSRGARAGGRGGELHVNERGSGTEVRCLVDRLALLRERRRRRDDVRDALGLGRGPLEVRVLVLVVVEVDLERLQARN